MPAPRVLWSPIGSRLFRLTFHNWYAVRRAILVAWGATLSRSSRVRPTAIISEPWNLTIGRESSIGDHARVECPAHVFLGDFVTISQHATITSTNLGPQGSGPAHGPAPVRIENDAWIGTDAFVGPGVNVGEGAILGAKATAFRDLAPWTIYGGEPLAVIATRAPPTG
jgi:putative colanic acid biosynthesis acetyltransferase WcaF